MKKFPTMLFGRTAETDVPRQVMPSPLTGIANQPAGLVMPQTDVPVMPELPTVESAVPQPVATTLAQLPNVIQTSALNQYVAPMPASKANTTASSNMALADLGSQANKIWQFKGFDTQSGLQGGTQNWSDLMNL